MTEALTGEKWLTSRQKRLTDIAIASALIPIATPVACVGAAAFYIESRINPLFRQTRIGRDGVPFKITKLRTMPYREDLSGTSFGTKDVTSSPIGDQLRKKRIDETPQLAHIISGEMSVVGPRPLIPSDVAITLSYLSPSEKDAWLHARSVAKPGWLSPFGNVCRDYERQSEAYIRARVENDCLYVENANRELDLSIMQIALTIGSTIINEDVSRRSLVS